MGSASLSEASPYQVAFLPHTASVHSVSFSPDGTLLASGSWDNSVRLWDVASRQQIASLEHSRGWLTSASFSPDGTLLATTGGGDGALLWDVASRQQIASLWHTASVSSVSFSPDGTLLATITEGYSGDSVWLWDVASRQQVASLRYTGNRKQWVSEVSFSPDSTLLATAGDGDGALLWDVASRQQIASLRHTGVENGNWVNRVSFSPDGTLLASAATDGGIRLWDVASRQQIATLTDHRGWRVSEVSFSPDGTLLAGGDSNGLLLWDVSEVELATPQTLTKVSGDGQRVPASTQLAKPFVVSVLDQDGSPVSRVRVAFSVTYGEGLLSSATNADPCAVGASASSTASHTDANGQASVRLTLGGKPGTNKVNATVEGLSSVTFIATAAEQATPHNLTKVCGDDQEGTAGEQLAMPFVVSVSDENGAAMSGVDVSFAVTAGGGALSSATATATTNANGRARTRLTLGSELGTNTVEAAVVGLESVTFTAAGEESPLAGFFDSFFGSGKRPSLPDQTQLLQNAPNPFNSQTVLSYFLLEPSLTRLEVFSLTGQRVAVLHQGPQQAGYHRLHWDGRDDAGFPVASGAYLYRLVTDEEVLTRKLILLR